MLLDIYLPDLDGLTMLRNLPRPPKVVVQSNSGERALEGFELGVSDYLLKPYPFDRFAKAMNRAVAEVRGGISAENAVAETTDHLILKTNHSLLKVYFRDIQYAEAMQNYTRVHLTTGEKPVALISLKGIQEQLTDRLFQRVHKSYVINLRHVDWLGTDSVRLGEHNLPVGPTYREGLSEAWLRASLTGL